MNVNDVNTGWLHQESLDGVDEFRISCEQVDLAFEADESLIDVVQFIVEPAENAPELQRAGSQLAIEQRGGRYRGKVTPLVRLPVSRCPEIETELGKGDLSFSEIQAPLAVKLGMGDVDVRNGGGPVGVSLGKGDVAITGFVHPVSVKLGMGDVAVSRCNAGVNLAVGKGDIAVADSGPELIIKNGAGDIAVARPVDGQMQIDTGRGDVAVTDGEAFRLTVRTGKGDIVSSARLSVRPGDEGEPVEDESDDDGFDVDEDFTFNLGDISLSDLEFEANEAGVRIGRGGRDVLRLGPEGVQITGGNRQISLGPDGVRVGGRGAKASGDQRFSFDTRRGDLHITVPTDLKARVEVLATGEIQSDVPMVSVGRPGPRGTVKRLVGVTDGGEQTGRVNVRLHTGRGDIALRSMRVAPRNTVQPAQRTEETDHDERARVILEALSRGDLSVGEAERLLAALDRSGYR